MRDSLKKIHEENFLSFFLSLIKKIFIFSAYVASDSFLFCYVNVLAKLGFIFGSEHRFLV